MLSSSLFALEKVTLQLHWLHQFQFAGYYMAKEKGFYEEAGLDVDIVQMAQKTDVIKDVVDSEAKYGIGRSSLLMEIIKGKELAVLAAIFQDSPSVLLSTNKHIKEPKDLKNKRVMVTLDELESTSILTTLASQNLTKEDIVLQAHSFKLRDLIEKKTDAMVCYLGNEPFTLNQGQIPYNIINPKDYGYNYYGDLLFTSIKEITNNPSRVTKFTQASIKGWEYAFDNIEESAKIIYDKYNTQNKTLEHLIYEAKVLKEYAYKNVDRIGILDNKIIKEITRMYALTGLIEFDKDITKYIDPLEINTQTIKIGVMSPPFLNKMTFKFSKLLEYLNHHIPGYRFEMVKLACKDIEYNLQNKDVDFLIVNPSNFIKYESKYSMTKLATLQKKFQNQYFSNFGLLFFTHKDNPLYDTKEIKNSFVTMLDPDICCSYSIAKYELSRKYNIDIDKDVELNFVNSFEEIVQSVASKHYDIGIIRTGVLENMHLENEINLEDIKAIFPQEFKNFPFMVSTDLYPEWAFVKLSHSANSLSKNILLNLLNYEDLDISWIAPLDDTKFHNLHKELEILPYEGQDFDIYDIWRKYKYSILIIIFALFIISLLGFALILAYKGLQRQKEEIELLNQNLEKKIEQSMHELLLINKQLQNSIKTDYLTQISSRSYFYEQSQEAFAFAKRHKLQLSILLLDIDYFKKVNDTYGHAMGDMVLQKFAAIIKDNLRQNDLFGRIGGEEFCICINNISSKHATDLGNKLRISVEEMKIVVGDITLKITTSIGVSQMKKDDKNIEDTIKRADIALYKAKNHGRNKVVFV